MHVRRITYIDNGASPMGWHDADQYQHNKDRENGDVCAALFRIWLKS